jgi:hypothetical protein
MPPDDVSELLDALRNKLIAALVGLETDRQRCGVARRRPGRDPSPP